MKTKKYYFQHKENNKYPKTLKCMFLKEKKNGWKALNIFFKINIVMSEAKKNPDSKDYISP